MAEVSTAAAPEGVLHRRIEFHLARRTHTAVAVGGGGFRMETLNPDAAGAAGAAATRSGEGEARRSEKGDAGGMDPELSVARIYLGRIGAGLRNLGNTCYLNSVLQCLTYTEPFAAYLQSGKHSSSCRTSGFCALCALQNHVKTALQSSGKIVSPLQIVKNLRCISRSFRNSRQEDAHELMVNLLESMHKCCLPSGVPSESQSAYDKSLVHKIFGGRLRSQVKCTRCSHCSNKFDPFLDLSLDIAKATTLVRALHNFTEEELLDGGEKQYQCERCRQKVVAKKSFRIDKAPNVLTIHLKRFSPFNPRQKIDKKVEFQPVLDLKPFVSDSKGADLKYSLYGVLVHVGWNTQTGHYYCFVRTSSGMWHNLDDNQVRQVREADVLKQKAYMLFYVRDSVGMPRRDNITANGTVRKAPEKVPCLNGATGSERKIQTMSNSSILAKSSIACSKYDAKMESSQNNGLPSVEKALAPQNDSATLPTKSIQSAATGLGPSSSDQPLLLLSGSGKQSITDSSSRELLPSADKVTSVASPLEAVVNGAAELSESDKRTYVPKTFPSGKQSITDSSSRELPPNTDKVTSVASPVVNGAAELSQSDKGTFIPQTVPFSKPSVYGNDIEIESTTQTHGNGIETGSSSQNHGNGIETGSSTQNHGNGIETGSATQTSVKGAIVSDGCLTSCEHLQESPGQANLTAVELVTGKNESAPELSQVDSGKQICSGGSVQVVMSSSCGGSIAEKVNHKPKKFVRYPVVNMCLGPRQLLVASLKLGKKTKHKKTRRRSVVCMPMPNSPCLADSVNEQLTSTSVAVPSETVGRISRRHKHANAVPGHKDSRPSKKRQKVAEACSGADTSAATDRSDPLKLDPSSPMDQTQTTKNVEPKLGGSRTVSVRARDLLEATVPCWDDIDASSTKTARTLDSKRSIGYVLDEWDEEYDRGKTKKVRRSKDDFDGSNPFQEEANYLSKKQMKQQNYQGKSWKKRDRVHESRV